MERKQTKAVRAAAAEAAAEAAEVAQEKQIMRGFHSLKITESDHATSAPKYKTIAAESSKLPKTFDATSKHPKTFDAKSKRPKANAAYRHPNPKTPKDAGLTLPLPFDISAVRDQYPCDTKKLVCDPGVKVCYRLMRCTANPESQLVDPTLCDRILPDIGLQLSVPALICFYADRNFARYIIEDHTLRIVFTSKARVKMPGSNFAYALYYVCVRNYDKAREYLALDTDNRQFHYICGIDIDMHTGSRDWKEELTGLFMNNIYGHLLFCYYKITDNHTAISFQHLIDCATVIDNNEVKIMLLYGYGYALSKDPANELPEETMMKLLNFTALGVSRYHTYGLYCAINHYFKHRNYEAAKRFALKNDLKNINFRMLLGQISAAEGDYQLAIDWFLTALETMEYIKIDHSILGFHLMFPVIDNIRGSKVKKTEKIVATHFCTQIYEFIESHKDKIDCSKLEKSLMETFLKYVRCM